MEEKSIRENSHEGSIESKSTFGQNPSKHYPMKLIKPKIINNISQLSMMNNIQNQPFPKGLEVNTVQNKQSSCSIHHDIKNLNFSILNNTSNMNEINHQNQSFYARNQMMNNSTHFHQMQQNMYMSPGKQDNIYKNQSVIHGVKIASFQNFRKNEKFYSAQKDGNKGKDQKKFENHEEYKELIDTFKNYQGKQYKIC